MSFVWKDSNVLQRIVSHEECTRFHAKNYASVRFCRRSGPMTKFFNVCENFARNVGHYCPFTRSSFGNILQTLRKYFKECWFFSVVWKGLISTFWLILTIAVIGGLKTEITLNYPGSWKIIQTNVGLASIDTTNPPGNGQTYM